MVGPTTDGGVSIAYFGEYGHATIDCYSTGELVVAIPNEGGFSFHEVDEANELEELLHEIHRSIPAPSAATDVGVRTPSGPGVRA